MDLINVGVAPWWVQNRCEVVGGGKQNNVQGQDYSSANPTYKNKL